MRAKNGEKFKKCIKREGGEGRGDYRIAQSIPCTYKYVKFEAYLNCIVELNFIKKGYIGYITLRFSLFCVWFKPLRLHVVQDLPRGGVREAQRRAVHPLRQQERAHWQTYAPSAPLSPPKKNYR